MVEIIGAFAAVALLACLIYFASCEEKDNRHAIFVVLIITMAVEAMLSGPAADVPIGLLRPRIGGQDFRPPDLVIVAALGARVLGIKGERISQVALAWSAFLFLYIAAALVGFMNGFATSDILFQAKGGFYLTGGIVIASGAEPSRVTAGVRRLGLVLAFAVPLAFLVSAANLRLSFTTPVQRFNNLGRLSNDSVTILVLVGSALAIVEVTREKPQLRYGIAALVLLFSPLVGGQRASYLVAGATGMLLLSLLMFKSWRRRSSVTGAEVGLLLAALVALVASNFIYAGGDDVTAPITDAFGGDAERRSAESRFELADQAIDRIQARPFLGWGAGVKVIRQAQLSNKEVAAAAHNVILDMGMRVGLIGLIVFFVAVISTIVAGWRIWSGPADNDRAATAMIGVILVIGVMTKAMVEPAIDKFRLSLSLGIGAGLVIASQRPSKVFPTVTSPVLVRRKR